MAGDGHHSLAHLVLERGAVLSPQPLFTFLEHGEHIVSTITAAELMEQATRIAGQLQSMTDAGSRVLLVFPHRLEFIVAFFGCLLAGVTAVPTVPPRSRRSIDSLLAVAASARPAVALTLDSLLPSLDPVLGECPSGYIRCSSIQDLVRDPQPSF